MGSVSRYTLLAVGILGTGFFVIFSGLMLLALSVNIMWSLRGDPRASLGAMAAEALLPAATLCGLNLMQTFRELDRIDPAAYREATRGKGVVSYMWSSRAAPAYLHLFLVALDCGGLPSSFARRVRRTIILDRMLMIGFLLLIVSGVYFALRK